MFFMGHPVFIMSEQAVNILNPGQQVTQILQTESSRVKQSHDDSNRVEKYQTESHSI